jgi:hypothetical protein
MMPWFRKTIKRCNVETRDGSLAKQCSAWVGKAEVFWPSTFLVEEDPYMPKLNKMSTCKFLSVTWDLNFDAAEKVLEIILHFQALNGL